MGKKNKVRRSKLARAAADPSGIDAANIAASIDANEAKLPMQQSIAILQRLSGGTSTQRAMACTALAHILLSVQHRTNSAGVNPVCEGLLKGGVVSKLLPLLFDPNIPTALAASGAIRNLSAVGGHSACEALTKHDAMTSLASVFTHSGIGAASEKDRQVIFAQVLSTIANMCESTETATTAFNRSNLLPTLLALLSPSTPPALAVEAAQLLFVVSEDNSRLAEFLSSSSSSPSSPLSTLMAAMTANNNNEAKQGWYWSINAEAVLSGQCDMRTASSSSAAPPSSASARVILSPQVAIAGTVVNVLGGLSNGKALTAQLLPSIIHTLSLALDVDPIERAGKLAQELQRLKAIVDQQIAEIENSRPEETKSKSKSKPKSASSSAAVDIDGDGDGDGDEVDSDMTSQPSVTQEGNVTVIVEGKNQEEKLSDKDPVVEIQNRWVQVVELLTNEWTEQVRAVKQALEILTNICTSGQAEGKEEEERTAFICKLFLQHNVLMKIVSKLNMRLGNAAPSTPAAAIVSVLDAVIPNPEDLAALCDSADQCRGRAITCLANVVMALPAKALGDVRGLFLHAVSLVEPLALAHKEAGEQKQGENKEQDKKAEVKKQEAVTQELVLLTLLLCNIVQSGAVQEVDKNHLMMFLLLMCNARSEEIRCHVVSLVSALGQLPAAQQYNAMIGTALLEVLAAFPANNPYVSLEVISECLNALIDLYSDDDLHAAVYKQLQITDKLLAFLAPFARQLQSLGRKLDPALAERLGEAVENGFQFIEYKKARGA